MLQGENLSMECRSGLEPWPNRIEQREDVADMSSASYRYGRRN
jgi:hypothetical protein